MIVKIYANYHYSDKETPASFTTEPASDDSRPIMVSIPDTMGPVRNSDGEIVVTIPDYDGCVEKPFSDVLSAYRGRPVIMHRSEEYGLWPCRLSTYVVIHPNRLSLDDGKTWITAEEAIDCCRTDAGLAGKIISSMEFFAILFVSNVIDMDEPKGEILKDLKAVEKYLIGYLAFISAPEREGQYKDLIIKD